MEDKEKLTPQDWLFLIGIVVVIGLIGIAILRTLFENIRYVFLLVVLAASAFSVFRTLKR
jgi:hypothetical protein